MMNEYFFSVNNGIKCLIVSLHSQFIAEIIADPEVMVTGKIVYCNSTVGELVQFRKQAVKALGNYRPILEPCVKKVPHDEELLCVFLDMVKKSNQPLFLHAFFLFCAQSEMSIRYEIHLRH